MSRFWKGGQRLLLEGMMPERALMRLKREGIPVYDVKKCKKNQILFYVNRKDSEKVFAIYSNVCYNNSINSVYTVKKTGTTGVWKYIELAKRRVGLLLGGLLCIILTLLSDSLVFEIECTGTNIYAREVSMALGEVGITPFSFYEKGKEDLVCAKLLAIDDVEFCSVKKIGHRVVVEIRTSPFFTPTLRSGMMQAQRSGTIVAITVLRGSPLKKIGDVVQTGDPLVGNWFETVDGGQVRVEIIARVRIACTWEGNVEAKDEEEAFAKAYLELGLQDAVAVTKKEIAENNGLYHVAIGYEWVERWNL